MGNVDRAAQAAARNQISAGSALVSLGAGMAFAGGAVLAWMVGTIKDAKDFESQIALVQTQTDKVKVSTKQLGDAVLGVANQVAVPIAQLTQGFYDIFSSMDVNLPQATHLLDQFAREAVAGQVDMQTASRATIGIMNAFHLPIESVSKVLDVQFQLVRKGVGTFEQFAGAIGKATPSAARAGQSIETLSGMLAFLTRNGLSADMAAASAARAFDAFSNPKVVTRLEKMGIAVKDSQGNFRDMGGVIQDLQKKFDGLTDPQRSAALQDLFKGAGGTIQARRFYDSVLKDKASVDQFLALIGDMKNAQGAFSQAYDTMANTTASKSQLLTNRWQEMRISIGQALIPILNQLLDWLGKLLNWWNNLSEATQRHIIMIVGITAAFVTLLGIVTVVAGAMTMLAGAAALAGISVGALLGIFAAVVVGIGLLVAGIVWLVDNWNKVIDVIHKVGDAFAGLPALITAFISGDLIKAVAEAKQGLDTHSKGFLQPVINNIKADLFTLGTGPEGVAAGNRIIDSITLGLSKSTKVDDFFGNMVGGIVDFIDHNLPKFQDPGRRIADAIRAGMFLENVRIQEQTVQDIIDGIVGVFQSHDKDFDVVGKNIADRLSEGITKEQQAGIDAGVNIMGSVFFGISSQDLQSTMFGINFVRLFNEGIDSQQQEAIKRGINTVGSVFFGLHTRDGDFTTFGIDVVNLFNSGMTLGQQALFQKAADLITGVVNQLKGRSGDVVAAGEEKGTSFASGIANRAVDAYRQGDAIAAGLPPHFSTSLFGVGQVIMDSLIGGLNARRDFLSRTLQAINAMIPLQKGPPAKDKVLLFNNGQLIMNGLIDGILSKKKMLHSTLQSFSNDIANILSGNGTGSDASNWMSGSGGVGPDGKPSSTSPLPYTYTPSNGQGGNLNQNITINTPSVVPGRDAALLGFELSRRVG